MKLCFLVLREVCLVVSVHFPSAVAVALKWDNLIGSFPTHACYQYSCFCSCVLAFQEMR